MQRMPLTHEPVFHQAAFAERYARQHRKMAEKFGRAVANRLSARGFQKGRIVDLGCGPGTTGLVVAKKFPDSQLVGLDLSEPLLQLAREQAKAAQLEGRTRFERADVRQVPCEDRSCEVVLCLNMVHLVEDPGQMLDEIERILVPGGYALVADLRRSWLGWVEREIRSALTVPEARQLFDRSRLRPGNFSSGLIWWRFQTSSSGG